MMSVNIIQKVRFKRYSALWGGDKLICEYMYYIKSVCEYDE